ncbi:MAG: NADH-ubiquinone oxidoreductase-F iron-sulfur binding region domain-containing protein, partial [bacterium]|nr:NADH-ubiquinone oxidoreductase-F iron-sulfur binding region domain-containing protein [bacterium]
IAVHRDSPLLPGLYQALDERDDRLAIRLVTPPARYVASEESALAHWVGTGLATPVYPVRPFQKGADGRPTLVQNVETLAHLALIARHGGDWFAAVGSSAAPGTTLITVGGAVAHAQVVEVPTGTTVTEILGLCGGATEEASGYLTGGYGGGWVAAGGFGDTGWSPDEMRAAGAVIGASVLWVMGRSVCPLDDMDRVTAWMAGESAGQCGPCLFGLPSVSEDVHQLATRSMTSDADLTRLTGRLRLVSNRGGCKHPDGTARFVSTGLNAFADEVAHHLNGRCTASAGRGGGSLPVPTARRALVDVGSRDFE